MKRKLALVLAAVMALSMLPMSVFAGSTASYSGQTHANLKEDTVTYEPSTSPKPILDNTDVEDLQEGGNIDITFDGTANSGKKDSYIILTLSNADWFFRSDVGGSYSRGDAKAVVDATNNSSYVKSSGTVEEDDEDFGSEKNYDTTEGIYLKGDGLTSALDGIYFKTSGGSLVGSPWFMSVKGNRAVVILTRKMAKDETISIPVVYKSDKDNEQVTLTIDGRNAGVDNRTQILVSGAEGATVASFSDVEEGRKTVKLAKLTISEARIGTFESGANASDNKGYFQITPPTGYTFVDKIWQGSPVQIQTSMFESGGDVLIKDDFCTTRRIVFQIVGHTKGARPASIEIEGLEVEPISDNTWGDITGLRIVNKYSNKGGAGVSNYTFNAVIGKRIDYGVQIVPVDDKDEVPSLFAGVFNSRYDESGMLGALEDEFKLLEFRVKENTDRSWWTERDTVLALPEGVRVVALEVLGGENLRGGIDGETAEFGTSRKAGDYVSYDKNEITIKDIKPADAREKRTEIDLAVWVSISTSMVGKDVEVAFKSGGGLSENERPEPLKVATVKSPIEVETKVTTIAAGRMQQPAADIILRETEVGALREDKDIWVSIYSTRYSVGKTGGDLEFARGDIELTKGDIDAELDGVKRASGSFLISIDGKSYDEPAEWIISNVRVNAYTTLPMSDKTPYQIVVHGDAIVENFDDSRDKSSNDGKRQGYFSDEDTDWGIYADYLTTTTATDVGRFDPTKEFLLSTNADDLWYQIDGERFGVSADMAPRLVDVAGGQTLLLSVRLVAEAFGCVVEWDPVRNVATIVLQENPRNIVQFAKGSAYYTVNGVERLMLYPDGSVATADAYEIDGLGRLYVPLRYLGIAMGVEWDEIGMLENGIAYFNLKTTEYDVEDDAE